MVINDRESTPLMISPKGGGRLAPRHIGRSAANANVNAAQQSSSRGGMDLDDEMNMNNIVNPNNGRLPTRRRNGFIPTQHQVRFPIPIWGH